MQREGILSELKFISKQSSLLDDTKVIEEEKYLSPSSGAGSKKEACVKEESVALASPTPSFLSNGRDPEQRQLEDAFLGREISFPSSKTFQVSDDCNSALLDAARKTANLVETSTTLPPGMLTSHGAWNLTPRHQYDISNNTVQDERIQSVLIAAAAELNILSETPKNEVDECLASVVAAQATMMWWGGKLSGANVNSFAIQITSVVPMFSNRTGKTRSGW